MDGHACCAPARPGRRQPPARRPAPRSEHPPPRGQVPVPAGSFAMGDAFGEGYAADGETPVHAVRLDAFRIDATAVTNAQFATFVKDTGYLTGAEEFGISAVFHLAWERNTDRRERDLRQPRGAGPVVARGPRRRLALARGPGLRRHPAAEPPRRARLLVRRAGLRRVGRQAAADRGGVGVRRAGRPGAEAGSPGATSSPRAAGGGATSGRASFPTAQHRGRRLPHHRAGEVLRPQRLRPLVHGRQRVGVVRRLVRPRLLRAHAPEHDPRGPGRRRAAGDARRLLPVPRLLLQPLPGRRALLEHPRVHGRRTPASAARATPDAPGPRARPATTWSSGASGTSARSPPCAATGRRTSYPWGSWSTSTPASPGASPRRTSQKVANLRRGTDPRVAVCQVDGRRWSTLEGTAEVRDDEASVAEAVRRYAERYRQPRENPDRVALRITITSVIGNV